MESTLQRGLEFIRTVQTYSSPPLTFVMRMFSVLGDELPYLLLIPLVYLCIDEKKGFRLGVMFLISTWINISLKILLNQPRPFFFCYDPSVGLSAARMGGLPSGRAQNSLVMLIIIASWLKGKWSFLCAIPLCILISFSRIYLGVHFPTDILGGWILGGVILSAYFLLGDKVESLLVKGGFRAGMIAAAAVSFIMIFNRPGEEALMLGGTMLGLGAGYCLNRRYVGFNSAMALMGKTGAAKYLFPLVRFLLGFTSLVLIFVAAGKIIPNNSANQNLYSFIRFALAGLWLCAGAPWVFVRLHLAETGKEQ